MRGKITLDSLSINGFRSIKELAFKPTNLNILIGPNGAGKSNFILFFDFVSWMLNSIDGKLQERITQLGGSSDILFDGPEVTKNLEGCIALRTPSGKNEYKFNLQFARPDRLYFAEEAYRFTPKNLTSEGDWTYLGGGHLEAKMASLKEKTPETIRSLIKKLVVYQFHNTAETAPLRLKWSVDDGRWLKANGQNLGSFLYRIQQKDPDYYFRIVKFIKAVLPFFDDFELYTEGYSILLRWKEKGSIKIFNAGQASDGMLRTIALIALLAQNPKDLPAVLFLDEPELGLHPAAVDLISGLIKSASNHCQVFVATQSVSLIDNFSPEDLVVIERKNRGSEYKRYTSEELKAYLEDEFTTGDLWELNIIGGRP